MKKRRRLSARGRLPLGMLISSTMGLSGAANSEIAQGEQWSQRGERDWHGPVLNRHPEQRVTTAEKNALVRGRVDEFARRSAVQASADDPIGGCGREQPEADGEKGEFGVTEGP